MLHKHAAAIRPYPPPTCQHAAARPNSRQIRQMSALPANPPFQSQFAARPNNRRHRQPTATHRPPCTREYPPPQSLINSRHHSSNAHADAPVPTSPLPSRKSPKILQILLQTIPPISHKLSSSLVKRSCERPCASGAPPIPKIPKNHANPASDSPPYLSKTLVISRQTLTRAPLRQRRPSHPENPPKSCKSSFRQSPQSLANTHDLSSNAHTSAPVPTSPLPSRKSPKIMQILLQTIPPISRKLSSNAPTSAPAPAAPLPSRKSPKIMQILLQTTRTTQITAHPQYPMTSYKRCYYPLSTIHWCPLKTYPPPDRELLCYSLSDV